MCSCCLPAVGALLRDQQCLCCSCFAAGTRSLCSVSMCAGVAVGVAAMLLEEGQAGRLPPFCSCACSTAAIAGDWLHPWTAVNQQHAAAGCGVTSWLERRGGSRRGILTQRHTQHDFGNSMWCGGGASQQQQAGKPHSFGWLAALLAGGGLLWWMLLLHTRWVGAPASVVGRYRCCGVMWHATQCSAVCGSAAGRLAAGPRWTGASHVSGWCSGRSCAGRGRGRLILVGGTLASGCISGGAAAAAERLSQSAAARSGVVREYQSMRGLLLPLQALCSSCWCAHAMCCMHLQLQLCSGRQLPAANTTCVSSNLQSV